MKMNIFKNWLLASLFFCFGIITTKAQDYPDPLFQDSLNVHWCGFSPLPNTESSMASRALPDPIPPGSAFICGNGRFRIIYMDIANGTGQGFDDPTLGAIRRNCVCSVIDYITTVIQIPNNIGVGSPTIDIIFQPSVNNPNASFLASANPVYDPIFINNPANIPAGHYGGYLYQYITTGVKPDPDSEDGIITVNFAPQYAYCTPNIGNCDFDFFSVILHEMTHLLGFFSHIHLNGGNPQSIFNPNVFSVFDQHFLYHNNGGTFNKLVNANAINPLVPGTALTGNNIWLQNQNLTTTRLNQPIYSRATFALGTSLSHYDDAFRPRTAISPGFSPNYLMNASGRTATLKRRYTMQELRMLQTLGYTINNTYPDFVNIGNHPPYTLGAIVNVNNSSYINQAVPNNNTNLHITTTNCNPVTVNLSTNTISANGQSHSLGIVDDENDPITVFESNIHNIRGCGNGGNNNNQVVVNAQNNIITFTPRNNFWGRAQFAFHLFDGRERGSYIVVTVDVNKDTCFVPTIAQVQSNQVNMVMNGDFEEGMELRLPATPWNNVVEFQDFTWYYNSGNVFLDGMQWISAGWQDPAIREGDVQCLFSNFDFPNNVPLPTNNVGDRYVRTAGFLEAFNLTLNQPVQNCRRYRLEADIMTDHNNAHTFQLGFNNVFNTTPTLLNQENIVSFPINPNQANVWMHISQDFIYSGATNNFLGVLPSTPAGVQYIYYLIDNLQLTDITAEILADAGADVYKCPNGPAVQIGSAPVAGHTYAWSPTTNLSCSTCANPTANPNITTTYTVTVTDACGITATDQVLVTVLPVPVVTIAQSGGSQCSGVTLTSNITPLGTYTYQWQLNNNNISGATASTYQATQNGSYRLIVTDVGGCTATSNTLNVTVSPPLTATITPDLNTLICSDGAVKLTASPANPSGQNIYTYQWSSNTDGSPSSPANHLAYGFFKPNPQQVYTAPLPQETYSVTVTDIATGCSAVATVTLDMPLYQSSTGLRAVVCCDGSTYIGLNQNGELDYSVTTYLSNVPSAIKTSTQSLKLWGKLIIDEPWNIANRTITFGPNAEIEIADNQLLGISQSNLKACGNYMWKGINAIGDNCAMGIFLSNISEAKSAVNVTDNCFGAYAYYVNFYDNFTSVDYSNFHNANGVSNSFLFYNTFDNGVLQTNLKMPHENRTFGHKAVNLNNAFDASHLLPIAANNFKKLDFGIYSSNAYFHAEGNTFENIPRNLAVTLSGNAIYAEDMNLFNSQIRNAVVVDNTFVNCYQGVSIWAPLLNKTIP